MELPWDLTTAYIDALQQWSLAGNPWSSVRVLHGPIRSFGLAGQTAQKPVCIVACAGLVGGEEFAAIGNVTDVSYRYAAAILVPDDDADSLACEKLRQDLVYAFDQFHQSRSHRDLLQIARNGRILACQFDIDSFWAEGEDVYRMAIFETAWTVRRR